MTMTHITKFFDHYNRVARLYPAVLTLSPVTWYVVAFGKQDAIDRTTGVMSMFALLALFYLMANVARWRGRTVELWLLEEWDGWPTTTLLRHRDRCIDANTKARYHAALSKLCGLAFPDANKERTNPKECDDIYRSGTKALLEARRGPEYRMVHDENASYGFRRNLYGLRPIAIGGGLLLLILTAGVWYVAHQDGPTGAALWAAVWREPTWAVVMAIDVTYIALFAFVVTPRFVLQSGVAYAEALLRTLEQAPKRKSKSTTFS